MTAAAPPVDLAPAGRSPWRDARQRFLRNRAAVASVIDNAPAGNRIIHGAAAITAAPSWISTPQLVIGSCTPRPRNDSTDSDRITPGTRIDV